MSDTLTKFYDYAINNPIMVGIVIFSIGGFFVHRNWDLVKDSVMAIFKFFRSDDLHIGDVLAKGYDMAGKMAKANLEHLNFFKDYMLEYKNIDIVLANINKAIASK